MEILLGSVASTCSDACTDSFGISGCRQSELAWPAGSVFLSAFWSRFAVRKPNGMYAVVKSSGMIVFRYDYRLNGCRETPTIERYGDDGISLSRARAAPIPIGVADRRPDFER